MEIELTPIGVIHSPFKTLSETPRWGTMTEEVAEIEIFAEYEDGLDKIERFAALEVLFYLNQAKRNILKVIPPNQTERRGVFATRSPARPNPIGLTRMELISRKGRFLTVKNVDMLDGTPIIDIKPHRDE